MVSPLAQPYHNPEEHAACLGGRSRSSRLQRFPSSHYEVEPLRSTAPGERVDNSATPSRGVIGARHKEGFAVFAKPIVCWADGGVEVAKNLPGALVICMRGKAQVAG